MGAKARGKGVLPINEVGFIIGYKLWLELRSENRLILYLLVKLLRLFRLILFTFSNQSLLDGLIQIFIFLLITFVNKRHSFVLLVG